jgi:hypothetical protein
MTASYKRTAERPSLEIWWYDRTGALIDFSSVYTFSLKLGNTGETALLTKTTNITGAAGSGSAPSGDPNITVAWASGDLDLDAGVYACDLTATTSSLDRVMSFPIQITETVQ